MYGIKLNSDFIFEFLQQNLIKHNRTWVAVRAIKSHGFKGSKNYVASHLIANQINNPFQAKYLDVDFWKGVHMYKGVGVSSADFISFFLNIR